MKNETKTKKQSFVFILSNIDVIGDLPVEVAPKHYFQKANDEQIKIIKEKIVLFSPAFYLMASLPFSSPYENDIIKIPGDKPGNFKFKLKLLPKEKWKYWAIVFEGTNSEIPKVSQAASLLENDLELGFTCLLYTSPSPRD